MNAPTSGLSLWYQGMARTAVVAAIFSLIVGVMLIGNEIGRARVYPFNHPQVLAMKQELKEIMKDEANAALAPAKEAEIRGLDQRLREEYFRREALAARGKWLLIGGIAVFLLAGELARRARLRLPDPTKTPVQDVWRNNAWSRWAVGSLGIVLAGGLTAMAAFPPPSYDAVFARAGGNYVPGVKAPGGPEIPAPADAPIQYIEREVEKIVEKVVEKPVVQLKEVVKYVATGPSTPAATSDEMLTNWPFFRGPLATGIAFNAKPLTKWDGEKGTNILWKTAIPLPGKNSPIVWKNQVFLCGADEEHRAVYAVNADTGEIAWTHEVKDVPGTPDEQPGVFPDTGFAAPTMATDGQRVFALFANGDLVALEMTGKRVWAMNLGLPQNMYGISQSLLVAGNKLIIAHNTNGDEDSRVYAFDVGSGKKIWESPMPVYGAWASPILIDTGLRKEIITAGNPLVIAYNPETGKEFWRADILSGDVAPSPVFANGLVYVVNTGAVLAAIRPDGKGDVTDDRVVWQAEDGLPDITSPLCDGDRVYLVTTDGLLTCYDALKGDKLWEEELDVMVHGSPTLVDGKIYLIDKDGAMHIIKPGNEYKLLGTVTLGETVETCPAFVGERIYIRGEDHLYCIGKKE